MAHDDDVPGAGSGSHPPAAKGPDPERSARVLDLAAELNLAFGADDEDDLAGPDPEAPAQDVPTGEPSPPSRPAPSGRGAAILEQLAMTFDDDDDDDVEDLPGEAPFPAEPSSSPVADEPPFPAEAPPSPEDLAASEAAAAAALAAELVASEPEPEPEPPASTTADDLAARLIAQRFEEETADSLALIRERMETYVRDLEAGTIWTTMPHQIRDWDVVLVGRKGAHTFLVYLKVVAELAGADLAELLEQEEEHLAEGVGAPSGETHAFLVVSPVLRDAGRLFVAADGFNHRNWNHSDADRPRGFLAYSDLEGSTPVIPGVENPVPDLAQILVAVDPETARALRAPKEPEAEAAPAPHVVEALEPDLEDFPELAELPELPTRKATPSEDPDRFRVLLVDADPSQLSRVRTCLGTWSYDIEQATDWSSFQRALASQEYAVLVMDQALGPLAGGQLALAVHSDDLIDPKPRIVLRAELSELELRSTGARLGAFARVTKDCDDAELKDAVRSSAMAYFRDTVARAES